jgi:AraC-like DNA-binding protein
MVNIEGVFHDVNPKWSIGKARGFDTLVYVTEGKVIYFIDNKRLELEKGEVLYIPYNLDRAWTSHPNESHHKYTAVFSWEKNWPEIPFAQREELIRFKPRNPAYYEQRFAFLYIQWLGRRSFYEHLSRFVLSELLILLSQERSERRASSAKERKARKMQEYILYNYQRNISIEELAGIAEVTPNYVTVLFKEVIGVTPIQYLHQIRINTAWNMLQNTQMTVREVAEYLGYCDQSYFNRMFKKWMGTAPTHHAHKMQKDHDLE